MLRTLSEPSCIRSSSAARRKPIRHGSSFRMLLLHCHAGGACAHQCVRVLLLASIVGMAVHVATTHACQRQTDIYIH